MNYKLRVAVLSLLVIAAGALFGYEYNAQFSNMQEYQFLIATRANNALNSGRIFQQAFAKIKNPKGGGTGDGSYVHPCAGTLIGGTCSLTDTTPPSVPTNVTATPTSCTSVNISWSESFDQSGMVKYNVYRNGLLLPPSSIVGNTNYTDSNASASTTYAYTVSAVDTYGNVSAQSAPVNVTMPGCLTWRDDFNGSALNSNRWVTSNKRAPGYITGTHIGYFEPGKIAVANGFVRLELTQENGTVDGNTSGIISRGGEIRTIGIYGYGTYEWQMKMSGTGATPSSTGSSVPGSVSAGFNYVNNSETEIDFEVEGDAGNKLYMTTWLNPDPTRDPVGSNHTVTSTIVSGMSSGFKNYKFVWSPGVVNFYVDNILKATHTTNIPSAPANIFMNHWGTDWGGISTVGVNRYAYIDWVRYTAPGENPL
ncbi:MAG: family 16 glycosylhydrolase [Patescibacteria group bacterium]